jgi:hypothetical protein
MSRETSTSRRGTIVSQQLALKRYLEKKREVEAVIALERVSTEFARRFEALGDDFDVVAEASKSNPVTKSTI